MRCPRVSSADIDGKESAELQLWSHVYRYSLMLWSFWAFKYFFELFCGNNWNNNTAYVSDLHGLIYSYQCYCTKWMEKWRQTTSRFFNFTANQKLDAHQNWFWNGKHANAELLPPQSSSCYPKEDWGLWLKARSTTLCVLETIQHKLAHPVYKITVQRSY